MPISTIIKAPNAEHKANQAGEVKYIILFLIHKASAFARFRPTKNDTALAILFATRLKTDLG